VIANNGSGAEIVHETPVMGGLYLFVPNSDEKDHNNGVAQPGKYAQFRASEG
jgi:hypothetical protein